MVTCRGCPEDKKIEEFFMPGICDQCCRYRDTRPEETKEFDKKRMNMENCKHKWEVLKIRNGTKIMLCRKCTLKTMET